MKRFNKAKMLLMNVVILGVVLAFAGQMYGDCYIWNVYTDPTGGSISHPDGTEHYHTDVNETLTCSRATDNDEKCHIHSPFETTQAADSMSSNHPRWTVSAGTLLTNNSTSVTYHTPTTKTLGVSVKIYEDDLPNSLGGCDTGSRNDSETLQDTKTVDVFCPHPENFRETASRDMGDGDLEFTYDWDSDCEVVAHLTNCQVGEKVDYPGEDDPYSPPDPPFDSWSLPNPTTSSHPGTWGGFLDQHTKGGGFSTPYCVETFAASQIYRYHCDKCMTPGQYTTLMGPHNIYRQVWSESPPLKYYYRVLKTGTYPAKYELPGQ